MFRFSRGWRILVAVFGLWAAFITFDPPMVARRLQRRNRMFRVTARPLHGTLVAKSLQIDNAILISGFFFEFQRLGNVCLSSL